MAATNNEISLASRDGDDGDGEAESTPTDATGCPRITQQATANFTSTTNFVNVGQVIQISGDHNTVVMTGNEFHVTQQNQKLSEHHHNHHPTTQPAAGSPEGSRPHATTGAPSSGVVATQISSQQVPTVRYAPGPPERLEIVTLMTRLTGTVGSEWKLLAAPLSISDADVNSIDYDERTLKLKINKLLTMWVDRDEGNDRAKLAQLLGGLPGYSLETDCAFSLKAL